MIHIKEGLVVKILKKYDDMIEIVVSINENNCKAIVYPHIIGNVSVGDRVILNTTAVDLKLGTGGYHFVVFNPSIHTKSSHHQGHIMKLKYTPIQIKCKTVEEQYPEIINSFNSLEGTPIMTGSIHSMLPPAATVIKAIKPNYKIAYIMTDGGALPIGFSHIVKKLKQKNIIDCTITCGNAFGGDLETLNLYTALIAAKKIAKCDAIIVIMGPGHAGTGTRFGFTGIEIANNAHTIYSLGGLPICIPRVSFKENRKRHYGISHHYLTAIGCHCFVPCQIAFPHFLDNEKKFILNQCKDVDLDKKHTIHFLKEDTISIMKENQLFIKTMGRTIDEDSYFFKTAGACGVLLTRLIS